MYKKVINDKMIARQDDIDNAVYSLILKFIEKDEKEYIKNIDIIHDIIEAIQEVLFQNCLGACYPWIVHGERLCMLGDCKNIKCQFLDDSTE